MVSLDRFIGRMGNNLFQIAAVIGYAEKHDLLFSIPKWQYQNYFKNKLPDRGRQTSLIFKEKKFHYSEIPKFRSVNLQGYFQSEKYFSHCEDLIRYYFEPIKQYEQLDYVAIHVRRGDYLQLPDYHFNLTMEYYNKAIALFPNDKFLIFSDDIPWCRENFKGDRFVFSEGESEMDDFFKMASCKHKIIANSSFSWWAAWLGSNADKIVVCPQTWFGKKANHDTKDLYCNGWTII